MKAKKTAQMCSLTRTNVSLTHKEELPMKAQVKFKLEWLRIGEKYQNLVSLPSCFVISNTQN